MSTEYISPCLICWKPVPDYKPEFCCSGWQCACQGQPTEPCVCSAKCFHALMDGIGKPLEQRAIDAGIPRYEEKQKNNLTEKQFPVYPSLHTNLSTSNDMTTKMLALIAGVLSTAFSQIQNICLGGTEPDAPPADAPKKTRGPNKAKPEPEAEEEETEVTVEVEKDDTAADGVDYDALRARAMTGVQKLFTQDRDKYKEPVKKLLIKHGAGKISELADNKVQPFMDDVRKLAAAK